MKRVASPVRTKAPYLCRILASKAGTGFEGDGLLRWRGRVWAVGRAGRVRAGAQPYLGPRPGLVSGRRHEVDGM